MAYFGHTSGLFILTVGSSAIGGLGGNVPWQRFALDLPIAAMDNAVIPKKMPRLRIKAQTPK